MLEIDHRTAIFSGTAITVPRVIWLTIRRSFDGYGVLDRSIFTPSSSRA